MAAPTYDPERTKEDLNHLTGVDADEERRIEAAAHTAQIKDLEDQYNAPVAKKSGDMSADELQQAENSNNGVGTGSRLQDGYEHAKSEAKQALRKRLINKVRSTVTPKRALIGGGIVSFLALLLIMSSGFSAFELVNLRENALTRGNNRYTNRVLQKRRAVTFGNMLEKMGSEKVPEKERTRIKESFEKQNFTVKFDGDGKLEEFSFKAKDGTVKKFDFKNDDTIKATNDFFGGKDFGLEASQAFDKVHATTGSLWRGPGARIVYSAYKFAFFNWLDKANSKNAKDPADKFAEKYRAANVTEQAITAQGTQTSKQLGDGQTATDNNGNDSATQAVTGDEILNGELNGGVSAQDYQNDLLKDPTKGDEVLGVKTNDVEKLVNDTSSGLATGGIKEAVLSKIGGGAFFKGSVGALAKGFNILGIAQEACEIKGILNFVSNVRNVMMTIELARFAIRILNAADDQKAGILSSSALNLMMLYLTYPNPTNGKGHTASGGEQWMKGDTGARPSKIDRSYFGTGRNNDGILGQINTFINAVPGIEHCKVVNNGFVSVGGLAVGIVAAVGSGGTITAADIATLVTLIAIHEVVVQVATPMLIKAGAHLTLNGHEKNGELVGDAFTSGIGALSGMVGGASGMRPSTKKQVLAMEPELQAYEHAEVAQQSVYTRYLSPSNSDSLASRVALAMPASFHAAALSFTGGLASMLRNITTFGMLKNFIPGSNRVALAADVNVCTDPQVVAHGIATDPFCNPVMANSPALDLKETKRILKDNKQIDDTGAPTDTKAGGDDNKSFNDYIALCFSGRPGILYNPHPDKEGNDSFTDDTCTESGPPLPGDSVGRYDRFAFWYGCRNDEESTLEQLGLSSVAVETKATFTQCIQ